jgi:hypothetical protein
MHIIIGAVLILAWFYFWLLGHWFARILAVPLFAAILGFTFAGIMTADAHPGPSNAAMGILIGLGLSWPAASLPTYYWRYRVRHASLELALRD